MPNCINKNYGYWQLQKRIRPKWFKQACDANLPEPNAMSLATVSHQAKPSQRMVLLKYFDREGFFFLLTTKAKKRDKSQKTPRYRCCFSG